MSEAPSASTSVRTERMLATTRQAVFAAFEQPELLAQWWGPSGFTNTFHQFDFEVGGHWVFTMHGPNGANFANECVFREIERDSRLVIEHVVSPWYLLTVTLTGDDDQTRLSWEQAFESPEFAARCANSVRRRTSRSSTASRSSSTGAP